MSVSLSLSLSLSLLQVCKFGFVAHLFSVELSRDLLRESVT